MIPEFGNAQIHKRQTLDAPYFDVFQDGEIFYLGFSAATCPAGPGQADCGVFKDFLSGLSSLSVIGTGTNSIHNRANDFSAFIQDDWKVSPRLTVNLGLGYDYFGPTTETDGHFVGFDPSKAQTVPIPNPFGAWVTPTCGVAVTGGFFQAGNGHLPGFPKVSNGLVDANYDNFGPRVGFAYRVTNSGNLVLRGGYGLYYDRPNMRLYNSQLFNMPYEMLASELATPNENPFVQVPAPSAFPLDLSNTAIFPFGGYPAFLPVTELTPGGPVTVETPVPATGIYPDLKNWRVPYGSHREPRVQWSFLNNWLLDVGYVGSFGRRFPRLFSFNQAATPATAGVPTVATLGGPFFPGFGDLTAPGLGSFLMETNSSSNYNSLQITLNKRISKGLQMLLSYTYSHSLDDYS